MNNNFLREEVRERTFMMIKPDGVQRNLSGEIITRLQLKGFKLIGLKMMKISRELAEQHYQEHTGKPFFGELVEFITSGPVIAMVWEGKDVIAAMRKIMGDTDPLKALPGTIRGDMAVSINRNIIHGSDSTEAAKREIALFFNKTELVEYSRDIENWIS